MPMVVTSSANAVSTDIGSSALTRPASSDVVEIGLLLPTNWANTLFELSRQRDQSVAQLLRSIIGSALHDTASSI